MLDNTKNDPFPPSKEVSQLNYINKTRHLGLLNYKSRYCYAPHHSKKTDPKRFKTKWASPIIKKNIWKTCMGFSVMFYKQDSFLASYKVIYEIKQI